MNALAQPRLYFHTFWTRPQFPAPGDDQDLELVDFEALTWLLSALEARRHGRMRMFTDSRGLRFLRNVGLEWVYDGGVSTELDHIPEVLNPLVFWSAGKLFAWRTISEPAVSVDPDAICWKPVEFETPVVALHTEELLSGDYGFQRAKYEAFGFTGADWNWTAAPVNTGVLGLADTGFVRAYAGESIRFMLEFSMALQSGPTPTPPNDDSWGDAMLFAEQRLISMMRFRSALPGTTLGWFDPRRRHMAPNSRCLHLWSTKSFYRRCREARAAYLNHLIAHTRRVFPEAVPTLARWGLEKPVTTESLPVDPPPPFPLRQTRDGHCRIGRIDGALWVQDANLPLRRRVLPGSIVGTAELLHPEPGTTYELIEVRFEEQTVGAGLRKGIGKELESCP